jgi:hypothetical protein
MSDRSRPQTKTRARHFAVELPAQRLFAQLRGRSHEIKIKPRHGPFLFQYVHEILCRDVPCGSLTVGDRNRMPANATKRAVKVGASGL